MQRGSGCRCAPVGLSGQELPRASAVGFALESSTRRRPGTFSSKECGTGDAGAAAATTGESIRPAFVAAPRHLPPRQRATPILRDVLGFSAREVADPHGSTAPSANSALQRARATPADRRQKTDGPLAQPSDAARRVPAEWVMNEPSSRGVVTRPTDGHRRSHRSELREPDHEHPGRPHGTHLARYSWAHCSAQ
ncbi:sigma factor-like helix-turn-helix DNA-binding protein [Streptomyces sp. NPDC058632]|uniref:sigma factor-like helix-turn-helix DNA-binding protein n=1 Tax=unclassified Streptomyces TaxID=2593676 RepID=UPI00364A8BE0